MNDCLNVGSVPRTDRLGNGPYKGSCPPRALLTVFSTTQLGHLKTQYESCHHGFRDARSKYLDFYRRCDNKVTRWMIHKGMI